MSIVIAKHIEKYGLNKQKVYYQLLNLETNKKFVFCKFFVYNLAMEGLEKAIQCFKSKKALANALGLNPMAVTQWKVRGTIPVRRAIQIERLTQGYVTRSELCPEIFSDLNPANPKSQTAMPVFLPANFNS